MFSFYPYLRWRRFDVFIVNFEPISHVGLVFLLSTLNMQLPAESVKQRLLQGIK